MLLAGILLWKLTPLFLSPGGLLEDPIALLYRPGGPLGIAVGTAGAVAVAVYRFVREKNLPPDFFRFALVSFLVLAVGGGTALNPRLFGTAQASRALEAPPPEGARGQLTDELLRSGSFFEDYLPDINWNADYLVLNFWAVWCPPCRGEIPELNAYFRGLPRNRVELVGINMTSSEKSKALVRDFMERTDISYPVLLDEEGLLSRRFQIESLPTTIIIGPKGRILARKTGVIDRIWLGSRTR